MLITVLKAKIHRAKVTQTNLYYEGSITIDALLMEKAGIFPGEKVEILNLHNGARLETYAIKGRRGSGVIFLNGPAARGACVGDEIIIVAYGLVDESQVKKVKPKIVKVDGRNRIKN
jgi:aspartate 1-decarboxylase